MDRILQVWMSEQDHDSLKRAARALHVSGKGALVRAFTDAVQRKSAQDLRRFLFLDDGDAAPDQRGRSK